MKLEKRASFLILPVILFGYALVAFEVYDRQSRSLINLEKARLALRLSELQSSYYEYDNFLESYESALLDGKLLNDYLEHPDDRYRERLVSTSLYAAVRRFREDYRGYTSLAIFSAENELMFYTADSTDPFSKVRPEQIQLAEKMQRDGAHHLKVHTPDDHASLLMHASSIDSHSHTESLATQLHDALKVIISITPSKFDALINQTKHEYHAQVEFLHTSNPGASTATSRNPLIASIELSNGYHLLVKPDENHIDNLLSRLEMRLTFVFFIVAFVSILSLAVLIRRFITAPIIELNEQLDEVMANTRANISASTGSDEISKLSRKFQRLYDALNQNLQNTHKQAHTDGLTKLPNRAAFRESARGNLLMVDKSNAAMSLIYIDLDNFKFVNDKYGHEIGDALLIAVAESFSQVVKPQGDHAEMFRLSGDEFVALLPYAENQEAQRIGEQILELFKSGYSFSLGHFPVTVSLGVATYPNDGTTLSKLVSNADLAMYQAKKSGKNRLATYSRHLATEDRRIREIDTRLKELDCDTEFRVFYMPVCDPSGRICGCEALLRWNSQDLGPVAAKDFIPIAESTGSFEKIDAWVLSHTFADSKHIFSQLPNDALIAINISSAELGSPHFISMISGLIEQHGITPSRFTLEITETFELHNNAQVLQQLNELRALGFKIAIDDFGTGYTSLMQMVDYPVDTIKFDMHLTERITDPERQGIGIALIALCHLQNMNVVAEGVESKAQLDFLCDANCDYLQGYYISEPMPLSVFTAWMTDNCTKDAYLKY